MVFPNKLIIPIHTIIIIEPIIWVASATSRKRTIPNINVKIVELKIVAVTKETSADFNSFRIIKQLIARINPLNASMAIYLIGTATPKGIYIRLRKKQYL